MYTHIHRYYACHIIAGRLPEAEDLVARDHALLVQVDEAVPNNHGIIVLTTVSN